MKLYTGTDALYDAYEEAKERIEGQGQEQCELAKSVISRITYAQRPLTTLELQHALAVEPGERQLNEDNIPDIEDIISVCAGLVTVDEESNVIRLVHYTTQEYFESIRKVWIPNAPANLGLTCITYLSFDNFTSGPSSDDESFEDRLAVNGLLDYAARYWGAHSGQADAQIKEAALTFHWGKSLASSASQALLVSLHQPPFYGGYV